MSKLVGVYCTAKPPRQLAVLWDLVLHDFHLDSYKSLQEFPFKPRINERAEWFMADKSQEAQPGPDASPVAAAARGLAVCSRRHPPNPRQRGSRGA